MSRSCKRSSEQRSKPSITKSFLSMTGRPDHTVERIGATPISVIRFEKNAGQSAAMLCLRPQRGAILVLIDGDLQNDPPILQNCSAKFHAARISSAVIARSRRDTRVKRLTTGLRTPFAAGTRTACATLRFVHAQSNAARVRQCAGSIQGDASLHSCSDKKRRVPAHGNSVNHRPRRFGETKYGLGDH